MPRVITGVSGNVTVWQPNYELVQTTVRAIAAIPIVRATQLKIYPSTQDVINIYGAYLKTANSHLDRVLADTEPLSKRIDKYLEDHGGKR